MRIELMRYDNGLNELVFWKTWSKGWVIWAWGGE
jgi:hypothetical protein